jgi:hypothetical protein
MKAREATLADKAAIIELWQRCALTRPWNDPSRDFDFAYSGPASAVIVLESDGVIVGAANTACLDKPSAFAMTDRLGGLALSRANPIRSNVARS